MRSRSTGWRPGQTGDREGGGYALITMGPRPQGDLDAVVAARCVGRRVRGQVPYPGVEHEWPAVAVWVAAFHGTARAQAIVQRQRLAARRPLPVRRRKRRQPRGPGRRYCSQASASNGRADAWKATAFQRKFTKEAMKGFIASRTGCP